MTGPTSRTTIQTELGTVCIKLCIFSIQAFQEKKLWILLRAGYIERVVMHSAMNITVVVAIIRAINDNI